MINFFGKFFRSMIFGVYVLKVKDCIFLRFLIFIIRGFYINYINLYFYLNCLFIFWLIVIIIIFKKIL